MSDLTRALVEILLTPYPEAQSTTNIFDSRSECLAPLALPTEKGVGGMDTLGRFHERAHVGPDAIGSEVSERQQDSPDSIIFDRHGDDRFADNILRALEAERN